MIIRLDDVLEEMYDKYPELKPSSIEKICSKGIKSINRIMRDGDELTVRGRVTDDEVKFFIPMKPEDHDEWAKRRYFKHKNKKKRQDDIKSND